MREEGVDARCDAGGVDRLIEIERWGQNEVTWKHQEAENSSSGDDLYRYIGLLLLNCVVIYFGNF